MRWISATLDSTKQAQLCNSIAAAYAKQTRVELKFWSNGSGRIYDVNLRYAPRGIADISHDITPFLGHDFDKIEYRSTLSSLSLPSPSLSVFVSLI